MGKVLSLLLIHGLGCSGADWALQIPALKTLFHVIVRALADLLGVLRVPVMSELDEGSVKEVQRSIALCN